MNVVTRARVGRPRKVETLYQWATLEDGTPLLVVRQGSASGTYRFREVVGRAFRLTPVTAGKPCEVFVAENGKDHSCSCDGFRAGGQCEHVSVLCHCRGNGELPGLV